MKTAPIVPARVDFSDAEVTQAPDYGDVYHARAGAFAQARHVFLGGNELPARWQGRDRFVILETGFGLGNNFLATWAAWRDDPQRCERLVFLSVEKHPLRREDLQRAHAASPAPELAAQLIQQWPALTHNLHALDFESGRVRLLLALGDARDWLPELVARVDAFYLDGFAPAKNPELWEAQLLKQLGRLAAPGASAATWSVARGVREGLSAAGFEVCKAPGFAAKGEMSVARFAPRHQPPQAPARVALAPQAREVLVIGAGLAGAACAQALARQGLQVRVLEALGAPAQAGSGNPGGLFHGSVHAEDGPHARFNRAAALATERMLRQLPQALPWLQWGLLRRERQAGDGTTLHAQAQRAGLPPDYVQALDGEALAACAGLPLAHAAWYFPGGGALPPGELARLWLDTSGAQLLTRQIVHGLARADGRWQALGADGDVLAQADAVVLAAGTANAALAAPWCAGPALPWSAQRGQLSLMAPERAHALPRLPRPLAGLGYALSLPGGHLAFGASAHAGDMEPALREGDQQQNLERLAQLLGRELPPTLLADLPLSGRVGWRSLLHDRLPLVGGLPAAVPAQRAEQPRFWPRHPGLAVCGALGSRGITWAWLSAELLAAQLCGAPWPLEASLAEALDPARFAARARRQG